MAWQPPKTDWTQFRLGTGLDKNIIKTTWASVESVLPDDLNRIEGNIKKIAQGYGTFEGISNQGSATESPWDWNNGVMARDLNRIEGNIQEIAGVNHSWVNMKSWQPSNTIDSDDFNRIEGNAQNIINGYGTINLGLTFGNDYNNAAPYPIHALPYYAIAIPPDMYLSAVSLQYSKVILAGNVYGFRINIRDIDSPAANSQTGNVFTKDIFLGDPGIINNAGGLFDLSSSAPIHDNDYSYDIVRGELRAYVYLLNSDRDVTAFSGGFVGMDNLNLQVKLLDTYY